MIIINLKDIIGIAVCAVGLIIAAVLYIIGTIQEKHKRK